MSKIKRQLVRFITTILSIFKRKTSGIELELKSKRPSNCKVENTTCANPFGTDSSLFSLRWKDILPYDYALPVAPRLNEASLPLVLSSYALNAIEYR